MSKLRKTRARFRLRPADRVRWPIAACIGLLLVVVCAMPARFLQSQEPGVLRVSREYVIKGTFLYQFGRYVDWPDESFDDVHAPLVIGVLGHDPFGAILDQIARTKRVDNRKIVIRRFAGLEEYAPCHILFLSRFVGPQEQQQVVRHLSGSPVLLVGETSAFARQGGAISFFIQENKVRFEINRQAAHRGRLKISSKLLSIGRLVEEESS